MFHFLCPVDSPLLGYNPEGRDSASRFLQTISSSARAGSLSRGLNNFDVMEKKMETATLHLLKLGLWRNSGKENGNYWFLSGLNRENGKENGNHYSIQAII